MGKEEIKSKLISIIANVAEKSEEEVSNADSLMDDIELSSMEVMVMFTEIEDSFGIKVEDQDIRDMLTIDEVVDYIEKKLN